MSLDNATSSTIAAEQATAEALSSTLADSIRSKLASVINPVETSKPTPTNEPMKIDSAGGASLAPQPVPAVTAFKPAVVPQAPITAPFQTTSIASSVPSTSPAVSPTSALAGVKRKPGRPKKGEEVEKLPKIPKKRGRPKKSLLEENRFEFSSMASKAAVPNFVPSATPNVLGASAEAVKPASNTMSVSSLLSGHNLPVSSFTSQPSSSDVSVEENPMRVNRNTVNINNLLNSPTAGSVTNGSQIEFDMSSFGASSSKRPRGRPRKNPSPGEHVISRKGLDGSSEKKRRGRPRRSDMVAQEYGLNSNRPAVSSNTLNPHSIQLSGDELDQFQIGESASSAEDDDVDFEESSSSESAEVVIAFHYGCYCGKKSPSLEDQLTERVDLLCSSCNMLFHQRCMAQMPAHSPMPGDWGYVFLCKNCNKKTNCTREHVQMYPKGWRDIVRIALYNLKFMAIIKGDNITSAFLLKEEVLKMIQDNWNRLCYGKGKSKRLEDLVLGTLKANPRLFTKTLRDDKEAWGLGVYDSPYLAFLTTKAKANYTNLSSTSERVDLMAMEIDANQVDYMLSVKEGDDEHSSVLVKFKDQTKPVVAINKSLATEKYRDKIVFYNKVSVPGSDPDPTQDENIDLNDAKSLPPVVKGATLPGPAQETKPQSIGVKELPQSKENMDLS